MTDLKRLYAIPEADRTPEEAAAITASEILRWGASFDAWRLATRAAQAAQAERPESEALWDATMAAFAAIASTPVDPGNDAGPFSEVAGSMDARRVRQALELVERMAATPGWIYRMNGSRTALASRLAALGHLAEAQAWLHRLDPGDDFHNHWRSTLQEALQTAAKVPSRSPQNTYR